MFTKKYNTIEGKVNIQDLKNRFEYEIKYLKKYFNLNNRSVESHKRELENNLIEEIENEPIKESQLIDFHQKEILLITGFYYHSSIVLVYTILENTLTQICARIQNDTNNLFSLDFLASRDNIGKTKHYLQITSGLKFERIEKVWPRIGQFQKLRNIIVHQNSTFKNVKEAANFKNMFKELEISDDQKRFHIINQNLIDYFIDKMEKLLNILFEDIDSKVFEINPRINIDSDNELPF